jgi:hypothetical protein
MYSHLVKHRRDLAAQYVLANRPTSVLATSEYLFQARHTDNKLGKAVSEDPRKCYETTSKDLQKLRRDGVVPCDALVFPSKLAGR